MPPGLTVAGYNANQRGYYIVQFRGPVEQVWKDQVTAAGGEILDYIPDYAFKVRMNPAAAAQVQALTDVAWVGVFQPAYKISPALKVDGVQLYQVRVEQGAEFGLTMAAIQTSGAELVGVQGNFLTVAANAGQVQAIAQVADVAWIDNFALNETHNASGAGVIMGANAAYTRGYDGSTQIAAVADTGLGGGGTGNAHDDLAGRVNNIFNWPGVTDSCFRTIVDDGAVDVDSGHGTHVAVSVLGSGATNTDAKGTAPAARLVFQSTENWVVTSNLCKLYGYPDAYYLTGLPADLRTLYQQAYDAGARIHANSWGSAQAGAYTANSLNSDDFIWGHRDMLITFSAGNEGIDANADGVIDNDSIGAPATAKNVLTVGASENQRAAYPCDTGLTYNSRDAYQPSTNCSGMGGNNLTGAYGQRWPADYPANPIASDPTADSMEEMAAFSSRGPTDDGRIKPDVVAPGTWILSGYSDLYQEGYDGGANPRNGAFQMDGWGMPVDGKHKYFGGTSMSNPLAAGAAVVVRDYYQKARALNASAALVKATLINSAVDLADENNDGANDNDFPIPNVHEGWGRINVDAATDGSALYVDNTAGLSTNSSVAYNAVVQTGGVLKVTLVWSDYRSTETAAKNLVNNLDLVVTGPGGVQYRGNVFAGGWSQTGGSADTTNNVENVYLAAAPAGVWTVSVSGLNIPNGPQPFALVVDGAASLAVAANPTIHLGALTGSRTLGSKNWTAIATATVHDAGHQPVQGVTVTGVWSTGGAAVTCTTAASGSCSISKTGIKNSVSSIGFTVTNLSKSGYTYNTGENHAATAVTILK